MSLNLQHNNRCLARTKVLGDSLTAVLALVSGDFAIDASNVHIFYKYY